MKTILTIFSLFLLSACTFPQDICSYQDAQVVDKGSDDAKRKWFKLRHKNEITWKVYVIDYDWNKYEIGHYVDCKYNSTINN